MAYYIKDYSLGSRQAVVKREESSCAERQQAETMYIYTDRIVFSSDQSSIRIDETIWKRLSDLQSGDIVSINDRGVCYRLYTAAEGDATIFMGGNCNSNCMMCPSSDYERHLDYTNNREALLRFIDMLPENLPHYVVTGGEPTMRSDLFLEVMERMADRVPEADALILTNGRSFSSMPFLEKLLLKCPPYLTAAIPIHGSCSCVHDAITRADGSFRQTMRGIHHLLSRGISVEIRVVVTKMNCGDLERVAELICNHFPQVLCVNFISLEVRGNCIKNKEEVYINPSESFCKAKTAINRLIGCGIDVGLYNYPLCCVERGYWFLCKKSISPEKVRYDEACDVCEVKDICGGLFVSTLKTVHPTVTPVTFHAKERNMQG